MNNITDLLSQASQCFDQSLALRLDERTLTFQELEENVSKLAQSLLHIGVKKGDVCAAYLFSNIEYCIFYLACFKIGAIVLPLSFRLKAVDLVYFIDYAKPILIISQQELIEELSQALSQHDQWDLLVIDSLNKHSFKKTFFWNDLLNKKHLKVLSFPNIGPEDIATYFSTSGTTGLPKLVIHQHKHFLANAENHAKLLGYKKDDVTLAPLAICFNLPFGHQFMASLYSGSCLELMPSFDPLKLLDKIKSKRCTLLYMVPSMYTQLLKHITDYTCIDHHLRACIVAGEAVPMALHEKFKEVFGLYLSEGIGMSEALFYAINIKQGYKLGSQGKSVIGSQVKVVDEEGHTAAIGSIGEIWIKSEMATSLGYLNRPIQNKQILCDGWLKTGDLAKIDREGYIWFRGRISSFISKNGLKIAPMEIEAIFYKHPFVLEACCVGVSAGGTVKIIAFISCKPNTTLESDKLIDYARQHLEAQACPDEIRFMDALPKGISNKIDRKTLQELAEKLTR